MHAQRERRNNNLANLQSLRGVAVLMVVCLHLLGYGGKYFPHIILPSWFLAGGAGVDLFFVISGFIITWITFDLDSSWRTALSFAVRRAMRIYPLYWALFLVLLPVVAARPEWINAASGHNVDLLASFLLLPQLIPPILPVAWTLTHELYFYLIYACLILLPHHLRGWGLIAWLAAVATAYFLQPLTSWFYITGSSGSESASQIVISHPATFEFGIGCLVAYLVGKWQFQIPRIAVLAAVGILGGAACLVYVGSGVAPLVHALLLGSAAGILVWFAVAADLRGERAFPSWFRWLGDISYSVYLLHVLVISAVGRLFHALAATGPLWQLAFVAAALCLIGGLGSLSFSHIEKRAISAGRVFGSYIEGGRAKVGLT